MTANFKILLKFAKKCGLKRFIATAFGKFGVFVLFVCELKICYKNLKMLSLISH